MTPAVSVIIPTFNRSGLIGQAIDSVLAQTIGESEIIVVDDGSTDDTARAVAGYGSRVRYISTSNGGAGRARNIGMLQARGRYVTFLDSDDVLYSYALEIGVRVLDRFPDVSLCCAEMTGFSDDGFFERYHLKTYHRSAYRDPSVTYERLFERSVPLLEAGVLPDRAVAEDPTVLRRRAYFGNIFDAYLLNIVLCQNTTILRREILPDAGLRNERMKYWEEVDFLLRICRRHRICFVDVPTYQLRYHHGQVSTTARADGKYIWMRKQQELLRVIQRHALADQAYYARHKARVDAHLAHLHRAVAVPMMLVPARRSSVRRYARRARAYLRGCARFGRPERLLSAISFLPGPIRRLGVTVVERGRTAMIGRQPARA